MGHQRALRRPGGARGVDQDRGVVARRLDWRKVLFSAPEQGPELGLFGTVVTDDDGFKRRRLFTAQSDGLSASAVRHYDLGAAVGEAVGERVATEQHRQRQRYGAELVYGDVCNGGFGPLRQHDADAVPLADADLPERVGESIRVGFELAEAQALLFSRGVF